MPTPSGFHVIVAVDLQVRQALGEDRQRLGELGTGEGGAEAVVDAGAERQLRLRRRRRGDVELLRVGEDVLLSVRLGKPDRRRTFPAGNSTSRYSMSVLAKRIVPRTVPK